MINWVLGSHNQEALPEGIGTKLPVIKAKCVLCDQPMVVSGYGVDPETKKTYKLKHTKNLAIECVTLLLRKVATAGQSVIENEEKWRM